MTTKERYRPLPDAEASIGEYREVPPENLIRRVLASQPGDAQLRTVYANQALGIETVVIYNDETINTSAVQQALAAKEAGDTSLIPYYLGNGPAKNTFLNAGIIIEAAKETGCSHIDVGYGPFAENAHFFRQALVEEIPVIGAEPDPMEQLGDKTKARERAESLNIPVIPGRHDLDTWEKAKQAAEELGYPIMLKAAGAGGGKGMFVVENEDDFRNRYYIAIGNAIDYNLGNPFIEKYMPGIHIEMQVAAAIDGSISIIGARNCTVQRRKQKLIEEAGDDLGVSPEIIEQIENYSRLLMQDTEYVGLATVEFTVFEGKVYFVEINTRRQVELTPTEIRVGMDLVKMQRPLHEGRLVNLVPKAEVVDSSHTIEVRLLAEDTETINHEGNHPLIPDFGATITRIECPPNLLEKGVVVDMGVGEGYTIAENLDHTMALLTVKGKTRKEAIDNMILALESIEVEGIHKETGEPLKTNKDMLLAILRSQAFQNQTIDTAWTEPFWKEYLKTQAEAENPKTRAVSIRHGLDVKPPLKRHMPYAEFVHYLYRPYSRLSPEGEKQLIATLDKMEPEELNKITYIITSPLFRAHDSAKVIQRYIWEKTGRSVYIEISTLLREVPIGADLLSEEEYTSLLEDLEGDPTGAFHEVIRRWEEGHEKLLENHAATYERVNKFLDRLEQIKKTMPGGIIITVDHGVLGRVLEYIQRGYTLKDGKFDPELLREIKERPHAGTLELEHQTK